MLSSPARASRPRSSRRSANRPLQTGVRLTRDERAARLAPIAAPARTTRESRRAARNPYINRELSWLDYAARVLFEAQDERNPLLDRVNFLTIFASMLDEFFQIRVAGLRQQLHAGSTKTSPDGRTAGEQLAVARKRVLQLVTDLSHGWSSIRHALGKEGIEIVKYGSIPQHHDALRQRFIDEIYPVLTPLAVDPGHPFPYISTLSLSIHFGAGPMAYSLPNASAGARKRRAAMIGRK